jgi:hypothetical protein
MTSEMATFRASIPAAERLPSATEGRDAAFGAYSCSGPNEKSIIGRNGEHQENSTLGSASS